MFYSLFFLLLLGPLNEKRSEKLKIHENNNLLQHKVVQYGLALLLVNFYFFLDKE